MDNTSIEINDASVRLLMTLLEAVPNNKRDATWRKVYGDVKSARDIWKILAVKQQITAVKKK